MELVVKYYSHSGFSIQFEDHFLLFDYYRGELPIKEIKSCKYPIVFSSHSHSDHYNKKILDLAKHNENIKYIFSKDISAGKVPIYMVDGDVARIHYLRKH